MKNKIKKILRWGSKIVYVSEKQYILNENNLKRFTNKNVIVTGGAGAIGRAICIRLASEGANVYVTGRTKEKLEIVANEIMHLGFKAQILELDITKETSIENVINKVEKIDVWVNCAGGSTRNESKALSEQAIEFIDSMLDINLKGTILCCKYVSKRMKQQKLGKIINISSVVGMNGMSNFCDYASSKAGVIGFSKSLALELAPYNITVNCVSPGFIQRGIIENEVYDRVLRKCPMNKIGTHEDVANSVAFIASDEASFITGQNLAVDGGRTLGLYGE